MYLSWVSDYRLMRWCDTPTPPSLTILQDRRRRGTNISLTVSEFVFHFWYLNYYFIVLLHLINRSYKLHTRLTPISPFQVCTPRNRLIVTKYFTQYHWIWCTVDTKQCHQTRVWWMTMNWATVCGDVLCSSVHLVCRRTQLFFCVAATPVTSLAIPHPSIRTLVAQSDKQRDAGN